MSFVIPFLIVCATLIMAGILVLRKFFLTNSSSAYVFMAIHWTLLGLLTIVFALLVKSFGGF